MSKCGRLRTILAWPLYFGKSSHFVSHLCWKWDGLTLAITSSYSHKLSHFVFKQTPLSETITVPKSFHLRAKWNSLNIAAVLVIAKNRSILCFNTASFGTICVRVWHDPWAIYSRPISKCQRPAFAAPRFVADILSHRCNVVSRVSRLVGSLIKWESLSHPLIRFGDGLDERWCR